MTPKQKAQKLYRDAFMRWCYELSHDKNVLTAKNICEYICNEVLKSTLVDDFENYKFWSEVRDILNTSNHKELYNNE